MNKPAYIFDGRNILDENEMKGIGYNFIRIGKKYVDREYHSWSLCRIVYSKSCS